MTAVRTSPEALAPPIARVRPTWRGWLHTVAVAAAIPGGIFLILRASHAAAVVAAAIYTAGLLIGFGTSAGYHRLARSERARRVMQRMDHSSIFVLIAGTYTPVCLLALPPAWGIPLLCVVGTGALAGIVVKQFGVDRVKFFEYALYPVLGWAAVATAPALVRSMTTTELVLLAAGGLLYTVGIPVLVRNRPDPWPRTFGYHEIWHAFTVAAGACHFAVVGLLIAR
jgi:hemolysin III